MRVIIAFAVFVAAIIVAGAMAAEAEARNTCKGARVAGEISGRVEMCLIGTDASSGAPVYQITVTQVDGPARATVGIAFSDGTVGFRDPALSTFDVPWCATNVLSFQMGVPVGLEAERIVFSDPIVQITDLASGRIAGIGLAKPKVC